MFAVFDKAMHILKYYPSCFTSYSIDIILIISNILKYLPTYTQTSEQIGCFKPNFYETSHIISGSCSMRLQNI